MKPFYLFDKWIDLDHVIWISELRTEYDDQFKGALSPEAAIQIGFMFKDEPLNFNLWYLLNIIGCTVEDIENEYNRLIKEWGSMNRPKPCSNYEGLLRQFNALTSLVETQGQCISEQNETIRQLREQIRLTDQSEIDALRDTNEKLTNELEELKDGVNRMFRWK